MLPNRSTQAITGIREEDLAILDCYCPCHYIDRDSGWNLQLLKIVMGGIEGCLVFWKAQKGVFFATKDNITGNSITFWQYCIITYMREPRIFTTSWRNFAPYWLVFLPRLCWCHPSAIRLVFICAEAKYKAWQFLATHSLVKNTHADVTMTAQLQTMNQLVIKHAAKTRPL